MPCRLIAILLFVFFASPVVAELELDENGLPKEDMLKAFEPYVGRWVGKAVNQPSKEILEPSNVVIEQEGKYILDNTMFQIRTIGEVDGTKIEITFLYGYDRVEESYCCWQYTEMGYAVKYKVEWAEDGKSYRKRLLNTEALGHTTVTDVQLDEGKAIRWSSKINKNDGELLVDQTGELAPDPGGIEFKEAKVKEDSPVAMFKPYTGRWKSKVRGKATDFYEKSYETKSDWIGRFSLGGGAFHFEGTADNAARETYDYLWITLYDTNEGKLMCWYHDSLHHHMKHRAEWDSKKRIFKQVPVEEMAWGMVPDFRTHLVDDETLRFTFKMQTEDGRLIVDESGEAKPVKGNLH